MFDIIATTVIVAGWVYCIFDEGFNPYALGLFLFIAVPTSLYLIFR